MENRSWVKEIEEQIRAQTAHTFILHGNVADDIIFNGEFRRLYEVLPEIDVIKHAGIVVFFNLASGVRFPNEEMKKAFLQLCIKPILDRLPDPKPGPEQYFEDNKRDVKEVFSWFNDLLLISWEKVSKNLNNNSFGDGATKNYLKGRTPSIPGIPFAVVVFEYLESKSPPESATGSSQLDRRVVETFQWWAQFPEIAKTHNIIIFVTIFLASIAPQLHDQTKGIIPIVVPLPNADEQTETIKLLEGQGLYRPIQKIDGSGIKTELRIEELAGLTSGLSRAEVVQIFKQAKIRQDFLTDAVLFAKKADIIQARLGDIVRIKKPDWGWEVIGGMDDKVAFAIVWAEAMRAKNIARMPKGGIILMGPPGTGKTVFAEAFAHELDIPFIEVMNTFNQFVGVSEQNMQNLLDTAWAMRPCVLFFDEVEQLLLPRGEVYHGDSGVFARSSRMLMQFFSDPRIHGQVVVFMATNRPDLLDTAMKRAGRLGAKLPFLVPKKKHRPSIWRALLQKEVIRLASSGVTLDISRVIEDDNLIIELSEMADFWINSKNQLVCGPPDDTKDEDDFVSLTGAEMEDIIGLSLQAFLPDLEIEALQSLSRSDLAKLLSEKFPAQDKFIVTAEALKTAMENYLPHEDVLTYRAMDQQALLSVNYLKFIPPEYRQQARELKASAAHPRRWQKS